MRLLVASDLHCDADAARRLVTQAAHVDVLVCAGDLAVKRKGLQEVVEILRRTPVPTVLVPDNGESDQELQAACAHWPEAGPLLAGCPRGAVLVSHSPPFGHLDDVGGRSMGSRAVLEGVQRAQPRLVVCGHIHGRWGSESWIGSSHVVNAGPRGRVVDLPLPLGNDGGLPSPPE